MYGRNGRSVVGWRVYLPLPSILAYVPLLLMMMMMVAVGGTCMDVMTAAATSTTKVGDTSYSVELVQVLHRHGARAPIVSFNTSLLCKSADCHELNRDGAHMIQQLGKYVRQRYDDVAPNLLPDAYDVTRVYSQSTSSTRTLQSGAAFVDAVFGTETSRAYPAVQVKQGWESTTLSVGSIPSMHARSEYDTEEYQAYVGQRVSQLFTQSELDKMAEEAHISQYCADLKSPAYCADLIHDIAASFRSTSDMSDMPTLRDNMDKLIQVAQRGGAFFFAYNASDPTQAPRGSYGYPFVNEVRKNMQSHRDNATAVNMFHYSAHDSTLSAVSSALGDESDEAMQPPFGAVFLFELLRADGTSGDDDVKNFKVRVLYGSPDVAYQSSHEYTVNAYAKLKCVDANGKLYAATDGTCPLEDFNRLVKYMKPQSEIGECYLTPHQKRAMGCPKDSRVSTVNANCSQYRTMCPAYACGHGYTLEAGSKAQCVTTMEGASGTANGVVVTLIVGLVATGAILMIVTFQVVTRAFQKKEDETYLLGINEDP